MASAGRFNLPADNGKSMSDLVADALRKAIVMRALRLGERLVESKVAAELNVSITPLRHAFQKLAAEGLIGIFPYRGSYVTTITHEFIDDVRCCRRMVELESAKQSYDNLVLRDPDCLGRIVDEGMKAYERTGDIYEVINKDLELHRTVVGNANHKTLLAFWLQLESRILLLQSYAKQKTYDVRQFHRRHIRIAETLSRKKGKDRFIAAMSENLDLAYSPEEVKIILAEAAQTD